MLSRRRFLLAGAAGAVSVAYGPVRLVRAQAPPTQTIELTATARNIGQYLYLPFQVPSGVNRVAVSITKTGGDAITGAGLFDQRGTDYQSSGFRGVYGEERSEFFVAADAASQAFIPGPIEPGEWTVIVPVFRTTVPTQVTATVTLTFGSQARAFVAGAPVEVVRDAPGWYRGDLHCHTPESSDAWKSRSAMTPAAWAAAARSVGLDFLAMTDHNVVSQNFHLARDAGDTGVLLMAGEEMTNWFHGHATVTGIDVGDWLDWRQTPAGLPLPSGVPGARISEFLATAREMGAFVSAAHPLGAQLSWQFLADGDLDPAARPDAFEVWTGPFQPDDEAALRMWDVRVRQGWRTWANGGTDLHGVRNTNGFVLGTPTTVVHADALSRTAVVDALRRGRCFVTRLPDGVELYISAGAKEGQRQIAGGTIFGSPEDVAEVEVLVRKASGMRLLVLRDGVPLTATTLSSDEQVVRASVPIGPAGGAVRAEVRSSPQVDPTNPIAGRTDMEAFTNPVLLVNGPVPADAAPDATAPPPTPGGRTSTPPTAAPGGGVLPATGNRGAAALGALALGAAGAGAAALARRAGVPDDAVVDMTLTELNIRVGCDPSLDAIALRLTGEVTAVCDGGFTLTRWAPSCCSQHDTPISVEVRTDVAVAVGQWAEVEGRCVGGGGGDPATVDASAVRSLGG